MDWRPLIVTAHFDDELFRTLDAWRKQYFPPAINFIPAHLTLFHKLPGDQIQTVQATVNAAWSGPLRCEVASPRFTGRGTNIIVDCPPLTAVHRRLSSAFEPWLTPQDRQTFRPHVTLQNKVDPATARKDFEHIQSNWIPRTGTITRLDLWRYAGGPWEKIE